VSFVQHTTHGRRFVYTNVGLAGEQKVDVVLLRPRSTGEHAVTAFIEVKYLRNRHRLSKHSPLGACDEAPSVLSSLASQVALQPALHHGNKEVRLIAQTTAVYGLVFCSFTRPAAEDDLAETYYKRMLKQAGEHRLIYHDLQSPYWRGVYEEYPVQVFGDTWLCSLKAGLWRPRAAQHSVAAAKRRAAGSAN
jgi:hypothetical protein